MARISKNEYYLGIARAVSKRSTCLKRHYGCVIVKNGEVISTGYNGNPRGQENCCDRGNCNRILVIIQIAIVFMQNKMPCCQLQGKT